MLYLHYTSLDTFPNIRYISPLHRHTSQLIIKDTNWEHVWCFFHVGFSSWRMKKASSGYLLEGFTKANCGFHWPPSAAKTRPARDDRTKSHPVELGQKRDQSLAWPDNEPVRLYHGSTSPSYMGLSHDILPCPVIFWIHYFLLILDPSDNWSSKNVLSLNNRLWPCW